MDARALQIHRRIGRIGKLGFSCLCRQCDAPVWTLTVYGTEDIKKFFVELDAPYITQHFVDAVYHYGNAYFMQKSASLRKRRDPREQTFQAAPLFNLLWFNGDPNKDIRLSMDAGKHIVLIMKDGKIYKNTIHYKEGGRNETNF